MEEQKEIVSGSESSDIDDKSDIDVSDYESDELSEFDHSSAEKVVNQTSTINKKSLLADKIDGTRTKNMSLGDLIKVRERIGTKKFNSEVLSSAKRRDKGKNSFKRENKNRPQEISSKLQVPQFREVIPIPKQQKAVRDPRFDNLCGSEYNEELFDKRYGFLEDIRKREKNLLQKQLHKTKTTASDEQQKLRYLLTRMKQQDFAKSKRQEEREAARMWKKEEANKVKLGIKNPFFLKNSDKKKMLLDIRQKKLEELGKGAIDKQEARLEKRKKSKESKVMPRQRRTAT